MWPAGCTLQRTLNPPKVPNPCFAHGYRLDRLLDERSVVPAFRGYRSLINPPQNKCTTTPVFGKITFRYNTMYYFVSVSSFTAYIIFTCRVRVRVRVSVKVRVLRVMVRVSASVRLRCHLANKVSVRCVYRSGE